LNYGDCSISDFRLGIADLLIRFLFGSACRILKKQMLISLVST